MCFPLRCDCEGCVDFAVSLSCLDVSNISFLQKSSSCLDFGKDVLIKRCHLFCLVLSSSGVDVKTLSCLFAYLPSLYNKAKFFILILLGLAGNISPKFNILPINILITIPT